MNILAGFRITEMSLLLFWTGARQQPIVRGSSGPLGMLTQANVRDQGSPPPLPPALENHPDYHIIRELGRGGMGVVYLAHNRLMARNEVLKVMGRHIVEQPGVMDRFLHEIRAVARLRHPNIVSAYTAFRCGEDLVFAMEYVAGLNLAQLVHAKGPTAIRQACNYIHQAALGLQYAHEEGMVHRDIKPANLMLSHQRDRALIKLLDFGLSKAASEQKAGEVGIAMAIDSYNLGAHLTCTGDMLGTPDFIAPEQIAESRQADIRADIYSLGCTLYYLLSGRAPFPNLTLRDVLKAHRSLHPRPLDQVRAEVPADLAAIVARMMAKEPDRRFAAPSEVASALAPFFKKAAAASVPPSAGSGPERVSADVRCGTEVPRPGPDAIADESKLARARSRWLWSAAAAGVLVLMLATVWVAGIVRVKNATEGAVVQVKPAKQDADIPAREKVREGKRGRTGSAEQPLPKGESAPVNAGSPLSDLPTDTFASAPETTPPSPAPILPPAIPPTTASVPVTTAAPTPSGHDSGNLHPKSVRSLPGSRGLRPRRNEPGNVPRMALATFRKEVPEISPSRDAPGKPPTVTRSPSYWECTDGETILTVDLRGNASYRRIPGWVPDPPNEGAVPGRPIGNGPDAAGLIQRTRRLAAPWVAAERLGLLKPAVKRETLLLAKLPGGAISEMRGRTIVRLIGLEDISWGFLQAVFDPEGALLRVDVALKDAYTTDLCDRVILDRLSAKTKPGSKTAPEPRLLL